MTFTEAETSDQAERLLMERADITAAEMAGDAYLFELAADITRDHVARILAEKGDRV